MVSRSYSGLLLCVVIILLGLDYYSANSYQGNIGIKRKWLVLSLHKDAFDGTTADDNGRKVVVGRKVLQGLNEEPLYISGKNNLESFQKPQVESDHFDAKNKEMVKQKENPQSGKENVFGKHEYDSMKKNEESKAFLEAADEVATLMGRDYRGAPRRKPPINNHEPRD